MLKTGKLPFHFLYIVLALFMASCGALKETAYAPDDVYYQNESEYERDVVAQADDAQGDSYFEEGSSNTDVDDYYDPNEARRTTRDFYDMTYRDPYYYRYGRHGFNTAAWGMGMGNPIGMGYNGFYGGYFGTGSFFGGGSSFYGYDPFRPSNMYWNSPWMSPYGNNAWGSAYYGGYSPYWMYPGSFYGNSFNPYMGYYDPYFGYYGAGGYCPSNFNPSVNNSAYSFGPRSDLNQLANLNAQGNVRSTTRPTGTQLMQNAASDLHRERARSAVIQQSRQERQVPDRVVINNGRNNNTRLSKPSRSSRNTNTDYTRDRSNNSRSSGGSFGGGSNDRGSRSSGGGRSGGRR